MILKVKSKNSKVKTTIQNSKFYLLGFGFSLYLLTLAFNCYAEEITILYTGSTHAALYPCACPYEPAGGLSRRYAAIKEIRKSHPALLLDSGGFFAGGAMDEYSQNTEMDKQRTAVNFQAMGLMGYDAVVPGDEEFNFGKEFLEEQIKGSQIAFLACNLKFNHVQPYLIKDVEGIKIGIVGVTNPQISQKAGGIDIADPKQAVKQTVQELGQKGVALIILLSHLPEEQEQDLLKEVPEIDILISGHFSQGQQNTRQGEKAITLKPSWQGKHLGKLILKLEKNEALQAKASGFSERNTERPLTAGLWPRRYEIKNYRMEDLILSDKVGESPEIQKILPQCFRDSDCRQVGKTGACKNPGQLSASCQFSAAAKINATVITVKKCSSCTTELAIKQLQSFFPGLTIDYLYYPQDYRAKKLTQDLGIKALPAYVLGTDIENQKNFSGLKDKFELRNGFYLLKPQYSGISYFLERKRTKGTVDLFISLFDKNSDKILETIRDFGPRVHFLALEQKDGFEAARGKPEVEECLRAVCVQKYYPQEFWNYIVCRAKDVGSSWWEDCLGNFDTGKIRTCAKGQEGKSLLKENIELNKELQMMFGPTYLIENKEVFGTEGVPTKEEFKKILKR